MRHRPLLVAALLCGAAAPALAVDLVVDAGGSTAFTHIDAAMGSARPGDRILVLPGEYPAFQFSKGVHVHGMGAVPGDVVVARVDYHVSEPTVGYDTSLTNMTVQDASAGAGYLAVTGNELPPGVLVLDGVVVMGGLYLAGGADDGFSLLVTNSRVEPSAGQGFLGASMHVGGPHNTVELVDSVVLGSDADPDHGLPAFSALRLLGGTRARLANARLRGGDGALGGSGAYETGADAVVDGLWPYPVALRVDGDSSIVGGAGVGAGTGGDGVDLSGAIELGLATVLGGTGFVPGSAWADAQPVPLPLEPYLALAPKRLDASGPTAFVTGDAFTLATGTPAATTALAFAFALDQPPAGKFFTLSPLPLLLIVPGNTATLAVPASPFGFDVPALMLHAQALARDATGLMHISQTATVRVDVLVTQP